MDKVIIVYNADSGLFNALLDWGHKISSPDTYNCNLCSLTYNHLGMHLQWQDFVNNLGIPIDFLHRNKFKNQYPINDLSLPAAHVLQNEKLELWISAERMNACQSLDDLKTLVQNKLEQMLDV